MRLSFLALSVRLIVAVLISDSPLFAATVYFNEAYQSSDAVVYNQFTSSIQINALFAGRSFSFSSADPSAANFDGTGNEIAGTLAFINPTTGLVTSIAGKVSRRETSGSTVRAFYFYTDGASIQNAFLLVVANSGIQSYFSGISKPADIGTNSAGVRDSLNAYLSEQKALPSISVSNTNATVTEDSANPLYAIFQVRLNTAANADVFFTPKLFSGSATVATTATPAAGDDVFASSTIEKSSDGTSWSNASSGVTIPIGSTAVNVRVRILGDTTLEGTETYTLWTQVLSSAANVPNDGGAFASGTILDNDLVDNTPPTIALSSSAATLRAGETAVITFTLSESASDFVAGDIVVSGGTLSDFAGPGTSYSATFTPTANSTTNGVISVASSKFSDAAGNFNADGADANNTVTIAVNTVPGALAVTSPTVNEASPYAAFTVTGSPGQTVSLALNGGTATGNGADYGSETATINLQYSLDNGANWLDYSTTVAFALPASGSVLARTPVVNDTFSDNNETFTLKATIAGGTATIGTCTIKDDGTGDIYRGDGTRDFTASKDDDRALMVTSPTVNEASPYAVFIVTGSPGQTVSLGLVGGTATGGGIDYGAGGGAMTLGSSNLECSLNGGAAWQVYKSAAAPVLAGAAMLVRTPIVNDALPDNNETFMLAAAPVGGRTAMGVCTIKDDGTGDIYKADGSLESGYTKDNDQTIFHSADSNRNLKIDAVELARLIALYNTRSGTIRTGAYKLLPGTVDGFAPNPELTSLPTGNYHAADTNFDGRLSLLELVRVIELFGQRYLTVNGKVRTGAYRSQSGTEDGFAPDDTRIP